MKHRKKSQSGFRHYLLAVLIALVMTVVIAAGLTFLPRLFGVELPWPVSFAQKLGGGKADGEPAPTPGRKITKVPQTISLKWDPVPNAVKYEFLLLDGSKVSPDKVILRQQLFINGAFLNRLHNHYPDDPNLLSRAYWVVRGLDYQGKPLQDFSAPRPITREIFDSPTVLIAGELDKMTDAPLYPSYAWIPRDDTIRYEVEVWQRSGADAKNGDVRKAVYQTEGAAFLDPAPFRQPGAYFWRVRPLTNNSRGDSWSEPQFFTVNPPETIRVAALGDSITHGGSLAAPPCYRIYSYIDYCPIPIKNLGHAGDTTDDLVNRFPEDVLPFSPEILLIMGGINDLRLGRTAEDVIDNLAALERTAWKRGIIPIFVTVLPVNPQRMASFPNVEPVTPGWEQELTKVNDWIRTRNYSIDVTSSQLIDEKGWLRETYSADGLHPDANTKKYVGETIGNYLKAMMPGY